MKKIILAIIALSTFSSVAIASTWYRNDELQISFAYNENWKPANAAEKGTLNVINWTAKTGGLIATCYLQAYEGSELSQSAIESLHKRKNEVTDSFMANMKKRYQKVSLISNEATLIDGYPAIFLIRDGTISNLGKETRLKAWTIVTVWKKHEVSLECASSVPFQFPNSQASKTVEEQILKILQTLHFER